MAGYRTRLIVDPADVPKGFVQIARVASNRTEAVWLSRAHSTGAIAAVKLARYASDRTGKVYVDPQQARELLESRRQRPSHNEVVREEKSWTISSADLERSNQQSAMLIQDLTLAVRDLQAAIELLSERLSNANVMSPA